MSWIKWNSVGKNHLGGKYLLSSLPTTFLHSLQKPNTVHQKSSFGRMWHKMKSFDMPWNMIGSKKIMVQNLEGKIQLLWNSVSISNLPHTIQSKVLNRGWSGVSHPHQALSKPFRRGTQGYFPADKPHSSWNPREIVQDVHYLLSHDIITLLGLTHIPIPRLSQVLYWDICPQGTSTLTELHVGVKPSKPHLKRKEMVTKVSSEWGEVGRRLHHSFWEQLNLSLSQEHCLIRAVFSVCWMISQASFHWGMELVCIVLWINVLLWMYFCSQILSLAILKP